jgi:hypothetical protein
MAGEQRKLAYASKRESTAMKVISLLGSIFLPGAYLAVCTQIALIILRANWFPVCFLHNVFQLPKRSRHRVCSISKFLAILAGDDSCYSDCRWDVVFMGKEATKVI